MTTTKEIQGFFHRLMELQQKGFKIVIENNGYKNYTSYSISKTKGNAKYEDCLVFYNGDTGEENACRPEDISIITLLEDLEKIVNKIDSIFED